MAKQNKETPIPLTEEVKSTKLETIPPPAPHDDRPIVTSLGMAKVRGGWVLVEVKTQGMKVIDSEVLEGPEIKPIIIEKLKLAVVRRMIMAEG